MLRRFYSVITSLLAFCVLEGCLVNDMSYPDVKPAITSIRFEGQVGEAVIDNDKRTVTVEIYETYDLGSVRLLEIASNYDSVITFGKGTTYNEMNTYMDLRTPVEVQVSVYESFTWTIIANQRITRHFKIRNQAGEEDINETEKMVVVKVADTNPLSEIEVLDAKLGIEGSEISPDFREVHDLRTLFISMSHIRGKRSVGECACFRGKSALK